MLVHLLHEKCPWDGTVHGRRELSLWSREQSRAGALFCWGLVRVFELCFMEDWRDVCFEGASVL